MIIDDDADYFSLFLTPPPFFIRLSIFAAMPD